MQVSSEQALHPGQAVPVAARPAQRRSFAALAGLRLETYLVSGALNILALALPIVVLQVYDRVIPNEAASTLSVLVLSLGAVMLIDALLSLGRAHITGWAGARAQHRLACEAFWRLLHADLGAYEETPPAMHMRRLKAVDTIKGFYAGQSLLFVVDLPFILIFLGLIALLGGELALVAIGVLVLMALFAQVTGRKLSSAIEDRSGADDRRSNFIVEVLRAIGTIKALGMEQLMVRRYERLLSSSAGASHALAETGAIARNTGLGVSQLMAVAVGAYGSTLVIDGQLSVGILAACTLLAGRATQPMLRALGLWTQFQSVRFARGQVQEILALPQERRASRAESPELRGALALDDVSFQYRDTGETLFDHIMLTVSPGEAIAVAGANGSGKSTFLGLIMGALQPSSGKVLLDGLDVYSIDPATLRRQLCYLPQKGALYQGTILDNLTMFRGERHIDRAMELAERLGLHEIVGRMPEGYNTYVDYGQSSRIPGGVRQRVALVRALTMVPEPRLLLFDEAYENLDEASSLALLELLQELREQSTMVIVSHRPTYLSLAHRNFVLRKGRLESAPGGARAQLSKLQQEISA